VTRNRLENTPYPSPPPQITISNDFVAFFQRALHCGWRFQRLGDAILGEFGASTEFLITFSVSLAFLIF
jgi:hypothetical protein